MYSFEYKKVSSLEEAYQAFSASDDGSYLAGGMTLIPTLKQRLASPSDLIDLGGISDLSGISLEKGVVSIGATTCHADVAASLDVRKAIPALANLAAQVGDPQVRNRGTIGGSIANNDPAADYPAAIVGLDATVHTSKRSIAADEFFSGMFETALEEGEIVTKVSFPIPEKAAYKKFPNPASRYAIVGVMVAKLGDGVRVAVTGAGPCVFRESAMEHALSANLAVDAIKDVKVNSNGLNGDIHASPEYRAHLVEVMTRRAVDEIS